MDVRLSVATRALLGGAAENLVSVAGRAAERGVLAIQREELNVLEAVHAVYPIVALQAVVAILGLVGAHESRCVAPVTGHTGLSVKLLDVAAMTGIAVQRLALVILSMADQVENCLGVVEGFPIQGSRLPGIRCVAGFAVRAEYTLMDGWLGVAAYALGRRPLEVRIVVAARARDLEMLTSERESSLAVIEANHAVVPIVAGQAVRPEIFEMLSHEDRIVISMAGLARTGCKPKTGLAAGMAGGAFHRRGLIIDGVLHQAEAGLGMVEEGQGSQGRVKIPAAMVRVAGRTGLGIFNLAVDTLPVLDFRIHVLVALQA